MKNLLFSLFAILSFSTFTLGQGNGWEWQNPLPQGNALLDLCPVDTLCVYAVGRKGTVLKTIDGGVNWVIQSSGTYKDITSVTFLDSQRGWAVGENGLIIKTTNGGLNWLNHSLASGNQVSKYFTSVSFVNDQTGWLVGNEPCSIYKTVDGGASWQVQSPSIGSSFQHCYTSVFFTDDQKGYITGSPGLILRTTNGGNSWFSVEIGIPDNLNSIHFLNQNIGYAIGSNPGKIIKTTDGGASWFQSFYGFGQSLNSVFAVDESFAYATTVSGKVLRTSNGGDIWMMNYGSILTIDDLNSVQFSGCKTGWAIGDCGFIMKTNDSGRTWKAQSSGSTNSIGNNNIFFLDSLNGWVVCGSKIHRTTNAGRNWLAAQQGLLQISQELFFTSLQIGWVVGGSQNSILKTTNSGINWELQNAGTTQELESCYFLDYLTGWVVGKNGVILKTTNGGTQWVSQTSGLVDDILAIHFSGPSNGIAISDKLGCVKTTDGGANWQIVSLGDGTFFIQNVQIIDHQTIYSMEINGMFRSLDGGHQWQNVGATYNRGFYFTDSQNGWIVGDTGGVANTTDGGLTWKKRQSIAKAHLSAVRFTSSQNGWVFGTDGTILHTSTGGVTPTHKTIVSSPSFSLYPNPAEENVTLSGKGDIVSVLAVDALGQVSPLTSQGGTQSILPSVDRHFDIRNLKPGLYWLKIQTSEGTKVQKLVKN